MTVRALAQTAAAITAGVGLALTVGSPANAAAPNERTTWEFHGTGTVDCGTFQDNYIDNFYGDVSIFNDSNGDPILYVIHWTHTSTDTNSATGLVLHEHGHFTERFDAVTGIDTLTGNQEVMNRPGSGAIIADTGHQVYDADGNLVFFAGGRKHSQVLLGDQPFCEGLA